MNSYPWRPITNALAVRVAGRVDARLQKLEAARREIKRLEARLEFLGVYVDVEGDRTYKLQQFTETREGVALSIQRDVQRSFVKALGFEYDRKVEIYQSCRAGEGYHLTLFSENDFRYGRYEKTLMLGESSLDVALEKGMQWVLHGNAVLVSFADKAGHSWEDIVSMEEQAARALAK